MELDFLGAAEEVGRSCVLVRTGEGNTIMLDCGVKIHSETPYPMTPSKLPDALVISHAHLDHSGFSPALFRERSPKVLCTPPTISMGEVIINDSINIMEKRGERPFRKHHLNRMLNSVVKLPFRKTQAVGRAKVTLHCAGHIPGASFVEVAADGKRIIYSGDFKLEETKTTFASVLPKKNPDVLIIESTYAEKEHPLRSELEKELGRHLEETLGAGGTVLLPAFAIGRTQELVRIVRSHNKDIDIWVDGMGWKISELCSKFSSFIKDFKRFRNDLESCNHVTHRRQREIILKKPCVIISTAGMLQGGPALSYLLRLGPESKAIFTGYCVENTNGHNLLNNGFVEYDGIKIKPKASYEYLDFSAHAGRSELFSFAEKLSPEKVYCMHGDSCAQFAEELKLEGFNASAPKLGDTVKV